MAEKDREAVETARRRKAWRKEIQSFFFRLSFMILLFWILFGVIFGLRPMPMKICHPESVLGDLMLFYRLDKSRQ